MPLTSGNTTQGHNQGALTSRRYVVISMVFHIAVFVAVSMQWNIFKKDQEEPEDVIISIDLMSLPEPAILEPEEQKAAPPAPEKPEPVSAPEKPPQPPKALSKPTPPRSVPEEEPEPVIEEVPPLPEEKKTEEVKVEEAPKPVSAPKPVKRPKPPVKKEPPKEPEKKPEKVEEEKPKTDFQSVLKNLVGPDAADIPIQQEADQAPANSNDRQVPTLTQPPPVSAQFTTGELAALQNQLAGCWSILPGARNAQNLKIEVELEINPNRTVRSASIADQVRYRSDPFFRAAADSALRALRNPNCSPLLLPEFKYDQWKNMIVVFDPKTMFR